MGNRIKNEDHPQYDSAGLYDNTIGRENDIIDEALAILKKRLKVGEVQFNSGSATRQHIALSCSDKEREEFGIMFLNNQHYLIADVIVATGSISSASVYPREIVKAVMRYNAAAVILYHNHPSGALVESMADKAITSKLQQALGLIDVRILDHIIAAGGDTMSFAEKRIL